MEKRIIKLEVILSVLLFLIPLILIVATGEIRSSISNYAYSSRDYLFHGLLAIAGTMFIFNGTAYNTKWYNIILGCALIGVVFTPHLDFSILHYFFAGTFFLGSVMCMIIFSSKKQRFFKVLAGLIIIIAIFGAIGAKWYSLFVAEWIGMFPICIHYIGESLKKID